MLSHRRTIIIGLALTMVIGTGAFVAVAKLHRQGYCISQQRVVPERDMFAAAVKVVYGMATFSVESLQDIRIGPKPTDGPGLHVGPKVRRQRRCPDEWID